MRLYAVFVHGLVNLFGRKAPPPDRPCPAPESDHLYGDGVNITARLEGLSTDNRAAIFRSRLKPLTPLDTKFRIIMNIYAYGPEAEP